MIAAIRTHLTRAAFDLKEKPLAGLAALAMLGILAVTLLWPIASAVFGAFVHEGQTSLYWFGRLFDDARTAQQLTNGVILACVTTLLSILLAVPLALLRARCSFRGQSLLGVGVLVPLILPPFVGALAMRRLLGRFGALNLLLAKVGLVEFGPGNLPPNWLGGGLAGVAIIQALHLFPIMYLNASAALANIDPSHIQAARNLGASPLKAFFRVTLPLMRPGLFAGGTIVFIWSFTDLGTPLMLNFHELMPVRIYEDLAGADFSGKTFATVFVLLAISVGLYVLGKFVFGRVQESSGGKATVRSETHKLGLAGTAGAWLLFGGVLFLAVLPHIGVILSAVTERWMASVLPQQYTAEHLKEVVTDEATYQSILNSLKYALSSTAFDLILGFGAAWLIVRSKAPFRNVLDAVVMLPLAVPGLILAAGYVRLTADPDSWLHAIGPGGSSPWVILIVAYAVRRLPFVVRGVGAGLQQVPETLEEAAWTLGSPRTATVGRITLPLVAANIIAAGVLTFAFAMLEVSDSLILAQRQAEYPITKQIYELYASGTIEGIHVAAALGVFGMVLLGGTMALAAGLLGKKLGAIFRA
jgi:iron(III) transport system permease protein